MNIAGMNIYIDTTPADQLGTILLTLMFSYIAVRMLGFIYRNDDDET